MPTQEILQQLLKQSGVTKLDDLQMTQLGSTEMVVAIPQAGVSPITQMVCPLQLS